MMLNENILEYIKDKPPLKELKGKVKVAPHNKKNNVNYCFSKDYDFYYCPVTLIQPGDCFVMYELMFTVLKTNLINYTSSSNLIETKSFIHENPFSIISNFTKKKIQPGKLTMVFIADSDSVIVWVPKGTFTNKLQTSSVCIASDGDVEEISITPKIKKKRK